MLARNDVNETRRPPDDFAFEEALAELQRIVERMETGQLSLEESLAHFEQGIRLARRCQQALREAEQRVDTLVERGGQTTIEPLDLHDDK